MWGTATLILGAKVVYDEGLELALNIEHVVGNAQPAADHAGVLHVIHVAATLVVGGQTGLVQAIQLHSHAGHLVTLPL